MSNGTTTAHIKRTYYLVKISELTGKKLHENVCKCVLFYPDFNYN